MPAASAASAADAAVRWLARAVVLDTEWPQRWYYLGVAAVRANRPAVACAAAQRAVAAAPRSVRSWRLLLATHFVAHEDGALLVAVADGAASAGPAGPTDRLALALLSWLAVRRGALGARPGRGRGRTLRTPGRRRGRCRI